MNESIRDPPPSFPEELEESLCRFRHDPDRRGPYQARSTGKPTTADAALDCDVVLAAQALNLNVPVVVATGNPGHLTRFVPAELWSNITP